ncbi:MAG: DUF4440 domain-containing protein [Candidatus Nanopelagicales bacterium]
MKRTTTLALLATTGVVALAPTVAAQAKSPVIDHAYTVWAKSIATADCDGSVVADQYTQRAILLATFKSYVKGHARITRYFDDLTCKHGVRVKTQRITTSREGRMGYATGLYRFSYREGGKLVNVPARFTFVFVKRGDTWLIANHHSSEVPAPH